MNVRKLSVNKACIFLAVLLLAAMVTISVALYALTQDITAVWYVLLFGIFVLFCSICFMVLVRRKLAMFSDAFCSLMDDMLSGNMQPKQTVEEESLFYKIEYRLNRLYEVMQKNKNSIAQERAVLWSSIFVTLMANKIGGLQFGIYRNCQISSRVFHTAVAALPLTKANRSDFE